MRFRRLTLGCTVMALSMGCYGYVPGTLDTTPAGTYVQAMLSTEGQIVLRDRVGIDAQVLRGELVEEAGDAVLISVRSIGASGELGIRESLYQRIDVPKSHILRVDHRQLDAVRTGGVLAAAGGGVTLIIIQAFGDRNPGDLNAPDGSPDERVVSGSIRLPFTIR